MRYPRKTLYSMAIALIAAFSSVAHAKSCWQQVKSQLETPAGVSAIDKATLDNDARVCLAQLLSNPKTSNRALQLLTSTDSGWAFLHDMHLALKTFDATDNTGTTSAHLGVSYAYDKSILTVPLHLPLHVTAPLEQECGDACVTALNIKFTTQGNVAFEKNVNPRDFLETHLNVAWFRSSGGASRLSSQAQDQYNALALKMAMVPAGQEVELQKYYQELSRLIANNLSDQWYVEFGGDVSLESDQTFRQKHLIYAARAALDFRGWSGMDATSWQEASTAAKFNIFDYPFALLRRLTGYTECSANQFCFIPLGTSWPTVSVAIGRVQPSQGDPRSQTAGNTDDYTRLATEASFKTPVARWNDQAIYLSIDYRLYKELSASSAVKNADLANFNYLAATVGLQSGVFVSYSAGRLPFDKSSDHIYELGFRFHLK